MAISKHSRAAGLAAMLGLTMLSRWLCRSHLLYDIDSVNFALALGRFDPVVHQPHPPGYFLYVCLGRLVNMVARDPNTALVLISVAASGAAAAAIYGLTDAWFGRRPAMFSWLLFLFSPLGWFHGTVALTYILEAFFSALVGYCCWRVQDGDRRWALPAAIALGVSAGIRPSSLLFLLPLWIFALRRSSRRQAVTSGMALALTVAAWFGPMVASCGGWAAYAGALRQLWTTVPARATLLNSSPVVSAARALTILWILVLCFGTAVFLIPWARNWRTGDARAKAVFTAVWVAPALLFFTFVFLNFVNSGYLLITTPPAFAWLAGLLDGLYARFAGHRVRFAAAVAAGCAANAALFLGAPLYCSHRSVRAFERQMTSVVSSMRKGYPAGETVIVGFDAHFSGYRHAAYYLPEYLTIQYPELRYPDGPRVFAVQCRETRLMGRLPVNRYSRFVVFPLPEGGEYLEYANKVLGQLNPRTLRTDRWGGVAFTSGPAAELALLFPRTASKPATVYTRSHDAP